MKKTDIPILLTDDAQTFIDQHLNDEPNELILKFSKESSLPITAIAEQISCIKKAEKKLPSFNKLNFLYEKTALEQSTSEVVANYKLNLLKGSMFIDLTGGLGIDVLTLAANFDKGIYCELNPLLVKLFENNCKLFGAKNIEIAEGDSIETLKKFIDNYFDCIYVDPARRDETRRSVDLNYCQPNIIEHLGLIERKGKRICVKLSPAFDFTEAKRVFPNLAEFIVISVNNECKEVLLILDALAKQITIKSVLLKNDSTIEYEIKEDETFEKQIASGNEEYFYLPDAAIIKADMASYIADKFNLRFVNESIDFLVGNKVEVFPGRSYKIIETGFYQQKLFKKKITDMNIANAQVLCKGFGETSDNMRKRLKLKEGLDYSLFFTRNNNGKQAYWICKREIAT